MQKQKRYAYRPKGNFIQIPRQVFIFTQLLRPSTDGKIYLFMYDMSIARGHTHTHLVSIREMESILGIQKSALHESVTRLRAMGALEVYQVYKNEGTRYTVNLPVWNGSSWDFYPAGQCPYLYKKGEAVDAEIPQDLLGFW